MDNAQQTNNPQGSSLKIFGLLILIVIVGAVIYFGAFKEKSTETPKTTPEKTVTEPAKDANTPQVVLASKFAEPEAVTVNVSPSVTKYTVEKDLGNVMNKGDFSLSEETKKLLTENGFVVTQSYYKEFFPLYEGNRYSFIPNFVTTDSILHNYHLIFNHLLEKLEEEQLSAKLGELNDAMLKAAIAKYDTLKNTSWGNAAKRNVGFFAVGSTLFNPQTNTPDFVADEVKEELELIEKHADITPSPVMNIGNPGGSILDLLKEDYSQYIPRGHYEKSELLQKYFKSMMWYGRLTFRFENEDEIKSAALITLALKDNVATWEKLYEPINFFVGKSDDINYYQLKDLVSGDITSDNAKFTALVEATKKLDAPKINSMPIFQANIQADREAEIKGFRFMGQRFTIDASIFQRLITREVGPKGDACTGGPFSGGRYLPKGLDITAAMGSKVAFDILKDLGETDYACYKENMGKMKEFLKALDESIWTQNLYWGWLYSLLPLTTEKAEGYPFFMQNVAWAKKELNTFLGSWAELKHDTILYAKQVYAELGGGMEPEEKDDRGYVEPNPYLYGRLSMLIKMTEKGLSDRGILSEKNAAVLKNMETLATSLKTISEKELTNTALTPEEYELIRSYGGQLEHLWLEINREKMEETGVNQSNYLDQNPAAIIADVATDPNGEVLEEGTGYIFSIFAVVPVDGKLKIAKGGVYSYYEFPWPMSDRLTDSKWWKLLEGQEAPALPTWVNAFMSLIE